MSKLTPLAVVKPTVKMSAMTADERAAFVRSITTLLRERYEAAKG